MKKEYRLTPEGLTEIKAELKALTERRGIIADKIKTAREFGDLSENAEYHTARDEQAQVETRINEINTILKNYELIETPKSDGRVALGSTVVLEQNGDKKELTIVGSVEADPLEHKISDESPIGQALLGKRVGDKAEISTPNGQTAYIVKAIK